MTDNISDLLTRIRNAASAKHETVKVPLSNFKEAVISVLKAEGFITDFEISGDGVHKTLTIYLKYNADKEPAFNVLKRVSRPGRRTYVGFDEIPSLYSGLGVSILSTSKGVLSNREAVESRIGGELLCSIW